MKGLTVVEEHRPDDRHPIDAVSASLSRQPLWEPASGRFDPVRLRAAIVTRGWTVGEFAAAARVSRACLYNALRGLAVSDRTVVRVVSTLEARTPTCLIEG